MSSRFTRFVRSLNEWMTAVGRARAWSELRVMGDLRLTQLGFSPELIKKGPDYFPWRAEATPQLALRPSVGTARKVGEVADEPANSGTAFSRDRAA